MLDLETLPRVPASARKSNRKPVALVFSRDRALIDRVVAASRPPWVVEVFDDGRSAPRRLIDPAVRLAIVDDEALDASERGWLVDQIRKRAPHAGIVYVAARHEPELERAIRGSGVFYYTSRPIEEDRVHRVLDAVFAQPAA
jgi:DNA-binding NarL/FixJ family response regulator